MLIWWLLLHCIVTVDAMHSQFQFYVSRYLIHFRVIFHHWLSTMYLFLQTKHKFFQFLHLKLLWTLISNFYFYVIPDHQNKKGRTKQSKIPTQFNLDSFYLQNFSLNIYPFWNRWRKRFLEVFVCFLGNHSGWKLVPSSNFNVDQLWRFERWVRVGVPWEGGKGKVEQNTK